MSSEREEPSDAHNYYVVDDTGGIVTVYATYRDAAAAAARVPSYRVEPDTYTEPPGRGWDDEEGDEYDGQ